MKSEVFNKTNKILKSNRQIEKSYTAKKRMEFIEKNQENNNFETNLYSLFTNFSEQDLLNGGKYGTQDPLASLELMIDYYLMPLIESSDFSSHIDEIEKLVLYFAPMEIELFDKIFIILKEKMDEAKISTIIFEVLILALKMHEMEILMFHKNSKKKNLYYRLYKENTEKKCILICEKYLKGLIIDLKAKYLITQAFMLMENQKLYNAILHFYRFLESQNKEKLQEFGVSQKLLKSCLLPLMLESNFLILN